MTQRHHFYFTFETPMQLQYRACSGPSTGRQGFSFRYYAASGLGHLSDVRYLFFQLGHHLLRVFRKSSPFVAMAIILSTAQHPLVSVQLATLHTYPRNLQYCLRRTRIKKSWGFLHGSGPRSGRADILVLWLEFRKACFHVWGPKCQDPKSDYSTSYD